MKKSLFALAAGLMATTSAFAMDVSNPFYIPMKGGFLSETEVKYLNYEHATRENMAGAETLSYGVTDRFALNASIGDILLMDTDGVKGHDRYDNPFWGVGLKYNLIDCCKTNWKLQLGANYDQGYDANHHNKALSAFVKAGYQVKNFLPYFTASVNKPIDDVEENPAWTGRVALNTAFSKKVNLDTGISYTWSSSTNAIRETTGRNKHASDWTLDAGLNYVFSDCMSVGLTAAYLLDKKPNNYDAYNVGVNFKVAF